MEINLNGEVANYELVELEGKQFHRVTVGEKVIYITPSYGEAKEIIWRDADGFTDDYLQSVGAAIVASQK